MSKPQKRKVTVSLRNIDKNDPKAILAAIREALRKQNVQLRVLDKPEDLLPPLNEKMVALEHLEAAAWHAAAQFLEKDAKQFAAAESRDPAEKAKSQTPAAVAKARKGVLTWIAEKVKAGWTVTVKASLEWAKEHLKSVGGTP